MKRNTNRHRSDDNFLHAMEGKVITVYRGARSPKQEDWQIFNRIISLFRLIIKSFTINGST